MANHGHNQRAQFRRHSQQPIGTITRGTTGFNRLRKVDRWVFYHPELHRKLRPHAVAAPLAIDVGYGDSYTTTCEWAWWLRRINPHISVVGLEIDPSRVLPPRDGVRFERGGFELAGYRPHLVRAFNVLRQYDVTQVPDAWSMVCGRLAPGGVFIEGTCDELGRRASWVLLDRRGPVSLTLAWQPWDVAKPSDVAERLPKILYRGRKFTHYCSFATTVGIKPMVWPHLGRESGGGKPKSYCVNTCRSHDHGCFGTTF